MEAKSRCVNQVNIHLFKVNNRNARKMCEICSTLAIKTPEQRHWHCSSVFSVNFEHISHLFLVFLLFTLNKSMLAGKLELHTKFCNFSLFLIPAKYKGQKSPACRLKPGQIRKNYKTRTTSIPSKKILAQSQQ